MKTINKHRQKGSAFELREFCVKSTFIKSPFLKELANDLDFYSANGKAKEEFPTVCCQNSLSWKLISVKRAEVCQENLFMAFSDTSLIFIIYCKNVHKTRI
jgi:hypothetical protein